MIDPDIDPRRKPHKFRTAGFNPFYCRYCSAARPAHKKCGHAIFVNACATCMKNQIEDLRNHLFATLEALQDEEKPMDLARAREIANVGRVIVDSAKVEVQFLKVTGERKSTNFLPLEEDEKEKPRLAAGVR